MLFKRIIWILKVFVVKFELQFQLFIMINVVDRLRVEIVYLYYWKGVEYILYEVD